jgi:hypothetical protein
VNRRIPPATPTHLPRRPPAVNPPQTTSCTYPGQISVDLPKINPGKVKILAVEAPAPDSPFADLVIFLDAACKLAPAPFKAPGRFYSTAEKPGAVLGGVVKKGQYSYIVRRLVGLQSSLPALIPLWRG